MRRDKYSEYVSGRLPSLFRSAYVLCGGDRHLADEIVQATITSLFVHWRRASRADNVDAYVQRMLVRKYIDQKRSGWLRVQLMWETPERADPAPADGLDDRDAVLDALRRLAPGQRAVLVLRFLCDLSVEETARTLNCSIGNVKSQTARALAAVRPMLDLAANGTEER